MCGAIPETSFSHFWKPLIAIVFNKFLGFFFFVRKTFKICYEGADHQKSKKKKGFVNNLCVFNHCKSFSLVGCFQKYALKLVLARNFEVFYFQDVQIFE